MSRGTQTLASAFFAIPLEHLEPETLLGFDLFLQHADHSPVLFRSRDLAFTRDVQERLAANGVARLLVPSEQAGAYNAYREQWTTAPDAAAAAPPSRLELDIDSVLADDSRPLRPRCTSLLGVSRTVVQIALSDLNTPGLSERVQRVAEATARFLLAEPKAYPTLVALLSLDLDTYNHSVNTALYTTELARAVGLTTWRDLAAVGRAALLHDIGKGQLPVELLHRDPATLSKAELEAVRSHTTRGVERLRQAGFDEPVSLDVCANHHERCDGSGYPRGLTGEELSVQSRIVAICDVFDSLTSSAHRRSALSGFQALWRMKRHMNGQFDSELLDAFVAAMVAPSGRD